MVDPNAGRHQSPWTFKQKVVRQLWSIAQGTVFGLSPRPAYGYRRWLLRCFGAKVGQHVKVFPSVRIEVPWNLTLGDESTVGDRAILYCLAPVTVGRFVTISQYAHLCAGTHDLRDRKMRLICLPITIGDDAWVATDAFVGPGVTIGARTVLGARSSAFSDLPEGVIAVGSPARVLRAREFAPGEEEKV
jgi:putative colanic acid biosynthesis acetyltransferase WcaF